MSRYLYIPTFLYQTKLKYLDKIQGKAHEYPMTKNSDRRQSTVYFPSNVLKRLKIYGITVDREMSDLVTEAVTEYLNRKGAAELPDAPEESGKYGRKRC